jgi:Domain of unknown function (DUF5658)
MENTSGTCVGNGLKVENKSNLTLPHHYARPFLNQRNKVRTISMSNQTLPLGLICLGILNIVDVFLTDLGLKMGWIEEGNPLMAFLYNIHPYALWGWKILLAVGSWSLLLVIDRLRSPWFTTMVWGANMLYLVVLGLHHWAWEVSM